MVILISQFANLLCSLLELYAVFNFSQEHKSMTTRET